MKRLAFGIILCLAASLARADTPPTAPTGLTASAGPGRTIRWGMGWDRSAGYGSDSLTVQVWRQDVAGVQTLWRADQTPEQMGCSITTGRYNCLDKTTWLPVMCGPEAYYRCIFETHLVGEPSKDFRYGIYVCDPGGCAPPAPQQPVWEADLKCLDNGGEGCNSDYHPVAAGP
jgi:hypothetical protein